MKAFKKIQINAKELKAELKAAGVKVIRCAKSNQGVSIVINDTEGNDQIFKAFCKNAGLRSQPLKDLKYSVSGISGEFIQYGTIFKFEEVKIN